MNIEDLLGPLAASTGFGLGDLVREYIQYCDEAEQMGCEPLDPTEWASYVKTMPREVVARNLLSHQEGRG
jgi:hypothetical protein